MEKYQFEVEQINVHNALWCGKHYNLRHCLVKVKAELLQWKSW